MLAYASLVRFCRRWDWKLKWDALLDAKLVRLANELASKGEMKLFWILNSNFQLKTKYPNNELKIALFHRFIQKLMIRLD